jgi:cytochrome oxidase Cu insertion factor (SCO1/SenC/PrrC family)
MMRQISLAFLLLLLLIASMSFAQRGPKDGVGLSPTDLERVKVGSPAPDFTLEGIDGKQIALSDYRGRKSLVLIFYRGQW